MEVVRKQIPVVKDLTINNYKRGETFLFHDEVMLRIEDVHTALSNGKRLLYCNAVCLKTGIPHIFSDHILKPVSGKFVEE